MVEYTDILVALIGGACVGVPTMITSLLTYKSQRKDREAELAENKKVLEMRFDSIDDKFEVMDKKMDAHNKKLDAHNGFEGRIIAIEKYIEFHEREIERLENAN